MWDLLTKTDIEQAKQEMKLRRAEILRRHAEEGQKLDGDRLELETLYRLVDTFVEKYAKPTVVSDAPKPPVVSHAPIVAPVSPKTDAVKPAHEARHHHQHHRDNHRHQGDTVFATFVRAASRH